MIPRIVVPALLAVIALGVPGARAQSAAAKPASDAPPPPPPPPPVPGSVQLDFVVASVGSNVILQSDVFEEMRFSALEPLRVLPGENTPDRALRRLIDRTLILQQMKEQQQAVTTSGPVVVKAIEQLRKEIPACAQYHCQTDQGWDAFLKAHGLTRQEVEKRWSQRLAILNFIDLRFRSGIRISPQQIANYYNKVLVPALAKRHDPIPQLADVSSRIHEILLQQQVSGMFQDWLASLRDQGNVRIVDPVYAAGIDAALASQSSDGDPNE